MLITTDYSRAWAPNAVRTVALVVPGAIAIFLSDGVAGYLVPLIHVAQAVVLLALRPLWQPAESRIWNSFLGLIVSAVATNLVFTLARFHENNRPLGALGGFLGVVALLFSVVGGILVVGPFFRVPSLVVPSWVLLVGFVAAGGVFQWIQPATSAAALPIAIKWVAIGAAVLVSLGGCCLARGLIALHRTAEQWIFASATVFSLGIVWIVAAHDHVPTSIGLMSGPPCIATGLLVVAALSPRSSLVGVPVKGLSLQPSRAVVAAALTVLGASAALLLGVKIGWSDSATIAVCLLAVGQSAVLVWTYCARRDHSWTDAAHPTREFRNELRTAVVKDQLEAFYQPIFRAGDRAPVGYECLVRWNHPRYGLLTAIEFLQMADLDNILDDIDLIMMRLTLDVLDDLLATLEGDEPFVSLNVPPRRLEQEGFAAKMFDELSRRGRDGTGLVLELTEHDAVECWDRLIANVDALQVMGIGIAVDDFGAGSANFTSLLRFDPDIVKLDRSLIEAAAQSERGRRLLRSAILAADSVGARIVAEGIEDVTTIAELHRLGVHFVQGYALGNPRSLTEILPVS